MNARAKPQTRFIAALIAAVLFAVGAGLHRLPADDTHATNTPAKAAAPALVKTAASKPAAAVAASAVLLPQIVVRPTAAERAAAKVDPLLADHSPFVQPGDATASAGGGYASSPRMNFDMPYYAFGKVLPRSASRE